MNLTLNVTLTTPEVTAAFFEGLRKLQNPQPQRETPAVFAPEAASGPNEQPAATQAAVAPAAPAAHVPVATAPVAPEESPASAASVQTPAVPVAGAPSYTFDDLARAAAPLMDAGKTAELQGLLRSFNAQALTQLPKEQYGAFATALRGMGARI
ncbi:MAG: hypothetical protein ACOYIR_07545 [Christensenellales bacterium]|jgi:hypothetical protein